MKKVAINNFRKIKENWELELDPITFLVGTNNSGKSSILKALILLDGYGNSNNHFILNFNGNTIVTIKLIDVASGMFYIEECHCKRISKSINFSSFVGDDIEVPF